MSAAAISQTVSQIIGEVRRSGDAALCRYAKKFDDLTLLPKQLRVSTKEIKAAQASLSPEFRSALRQCAANIKAFAEEEKKRLAKSWIQKKGSRLVGQLIRPVDSVGLYIPGGRFPYPSTVLMTAVPARVAGVERIIMATPPKNLTPEVIAAAAYAGVQEIYRMGGAGAIAALALGTHSVKPVNLIVGPGNSFVTEAKRQLYGVVGIDLLAGPSEVVVITDGSVPLEYLETDLQAQAEHDPDANSVLFSTSQSLLRDVKAKFDPALTSRVKLYYVKSIDEAIKCANEIAPEHLELLFKNAEKALPKIRHAGAIFVGAGSPAAMGDYVAGPSHVLPTNRAAKFSSGLSVATFLKRSSVIGFKGVTQERSDWQSALAMAETEGMEFHARSLRCRMQPKR